MSGIRVLLVDDEEELVATLRERLEMRGMRAVAATTGERAVELVREMPFDVAVVDLKMPGLDGRKIVGFIRERQPTTRVLLITGHGSGHGEVEELPNLDLPILLKPFRIERLVEQIQELAAGREAAP